MNNRKIVIDQVCILNRESISKKDCPKSIYYLDTGNITRNKISELVLLVGGSSEYPSRAQRRVKDKTIIYSTVRPNLRHFGILVSPADNLIVSTGFTTLDVTDREIDPLYLYYSLTRDEITNYLHTVAENSVSAYPSINPSDIGCLNLVVPKSLSDQRRIASVLSAIDSKIDLNNRIDKELEGMAKLMYDYWFVQFDFPISAAQAAEMGDSSLEGKPYRASGGKMVFSEVLKREVPVGWVAKRLSDLTKVAKQTVNPSSNPTKNYKLFSIPTFDATGTFGIELGAEIGSNKFEVSGNDVLVSKLNPRFSRVIYTESGLEAICSTEFVVWQTTSNWMKAFLFMVARSPEFISFCSKSATGTSNSHKRVVPDVMMSHAVPYEQLTVRSFGEKLNSMLLARQLNQTQNKELAELRDWLLPMLMNGQVTVGAVQHQMALSDL